MTQRPPLLRRLLHDLPPEQEGYEPGKGSSPRGALTDREAWLCVRSRLVAPKPPGAWLIWILGPAAFGLAAALVVLWLRHSPMQSPAGTAVVAELQSVDSAPVVQNKSELASGEAPVQLALPEGSFALVEPHGNLALLELRAEHVALRLESGAVYVHAAPQRLGELRVYAGDYVVVVHGTGFRVEFISDRLRVQLRHGSVEVRSLGSSTAGRFLAPGEEILIDEHQPLGAARLEHISRGELDLLAAEEGDTLAISTAGSRTTSETHVHHASTRTSGPAAPKEGLGASAEAVAPQLGTVEAVTPRVPSLQADIARCRTLYGVPERLEGEPETTLRLDLTVSETGQVVAAAAEHGTTDPRLGGCLAEAALDWRLDAPPESLRGMQFVFPIKL